GDMTTTVLQNIQVLSAGQTIQPDARGQAINAASVTLLVTPEQAETLTLAGNDGRIQLVLRNSSDQAIEKTNGRFITELYNRTRTDKPKPTVQAKPKPKPVVVAQAPPPPPAAPAPPPVSQIIEIRGEKRSVVTLQQGEKN